MPYLVLNPALAAPAPIGVSFGAPKTSVGKTLAGMRDRLVMELGNREDLSSALLDELINEAYLDVAGSLDLPELKGSFAISTVVGQPFYLLPPGVDIVTGISLGDSSTYPPPPPLRKLDRNFYRGLPAQDGEPTSAFREGTMLVLWPTPDDVYSVTVDIEIAPQKLVQDTDSPILEEKWHEAIYRGAKARGFDSSYNDTRAALQENQVTRLIRRKRDTNDDDEDKQGGMRPARRASDLRKSPWYTQPPRDA